MGTLLFRKIRTCKCGLSQRTCVEQNPGGARRDRTADLLHAMQALSQLSYGPAAGSREEYGGVACPSSVFPTTQASVTWCPHRAGGESNRILPDTRLCCSDERDCKGGRCTKSASSVTLPW